jgi:hypothetical protein
MKNCAPLLSRAVSVIHKPQNGIAGVAKIWSRDWSTSLIQLWDSWDSYHIIVCLWKQKTTISVDAIFMTYKMTQKSPENLMQYQVPRLIWWAGRLDNNLHKLELLIQSSVQHSEWQVHLVSSKVATTIRVRAPIPANCTCHYILEEECKVWRPEVNACIAELHSSSRM